MPTKEVDAPGGRRFIQGDDRRADRERHRRHAERPAAAAFVEESRGVGDRSGVARRHLQRAHAGQIGNHDLEAGAGERLGESDDLRIVAAPRGEPGISTMPARAASPGA